ncbi:MAG: DUF1638 domain-containing protein, partial [Ignavibacteria bacterium]|nr:DUF1638 domain-containing protein [Ignavibacteria bacterium]
MKDKLCIFACNSVAAEVSSVLKNGNYPDVKLQTFQTSCVGSQITIERILALISDEKENFSKIIFFVGNCHARKMDNESLHPKLKLVVLEQCFELILNKEIIYHYIRQGNYIISNGWLKNYKHHIAEWGFTDQSAKVFFTESINKILFLDSGIDTDYLPKLKSVSDYMGLPYEILPVGLSHCRNYIDSEVSVWRAEKESKFINEELAQITKENADYFFVFQQLQHLVDLTDESIIVKEVFMLLNLLFSPKQISFQYIRKNAYGDTMWMNDTPSGCEKSKNDFMAIEIVHQNESLGVFEIYGIKFLKYIDQYKKIQPIISKICGL